MNGFRLTVIYVMLHFGSALAGLLQLLKKTGIMSGLALCVKRQLPS